MGKAELMVYIKMLYLDVKDSFWYTFLFYLQAHKNLELKLSKVVELQKYHVLALKDFEVRLLLFNILNTIYINISPLMPY